jgi:hypothetical protein
MIKYEIKVNFVKIVLSQPMWRFFLRDLPARQPHLRLLLAK